MKFKDILSSFFGNKEQATAPQSLTRSSRPNKEYASSVTKYSAALRTTLDMMQSVQPKRRYFAEQAISQLVDYFPLSSPTGRERTVFKRIIAHFTDQEPAQPLLTSDGRLDYKSLRRYWGNLDYLERVVLPIEQALDAEEQLRLEEKRREEEEKRLAEEKKRREEEERLRKARLADPGIIKIAHGYEGYAASYCAGWCGDMQRAFEDSRR